MHLQEAKECKTPQFTETSTAPDEAVAVINLGEQGPGSNSEVVFLRDPTTIQQCTVGDVVSSGRENEIQRKGHSHPNVTTSERRQQQNASAGSEGTQGLLNTFTDTSMVPDEAVAAVNLSGQEPSSNSEIVGDVVSSGRENEIQREGPSHPSVTTTERRQQQNASAGSEGMQGRNLPDGHLYDEVAGENYESTEMMKKANLKTNLDPSRTYS
ncbi:PREDICTED: uncharacterized protein LOC107329705, partial [Acropora digitifera]|uniref:uncharacterized protein LOC107329705 n=1 Tax=Acropora digitifera TaxID=70779 RepID=UPI00077A39A2